MNKNKVVVITGASSGIGYETANLFLKKGFIVYGLSRTLAKEPLEINVNYSSKNECDTKTNNLIEFVCDVTDSESIKKHYENIFLIEGRIDLVICNAGIGISGASEFLEKPQTQKQIDINLIGMIESARFAVPYLKQTKGKIFFTSSVAALTPLPFQAAYSASKAGINAYAMALRIELQRFGIKVCAVMPGDTKTGFTSAREKNNMQTGYDGKLEKSVKKMEKDERGGMSALSVAKVFYKLNQKKNPKPLVCIGFSYKLIAFAVKILPQRLKLYILKKMYG